MNNYILLFSLIMALIFKMTTETRAQPTIRDASSAEEIDSMTLEEALREGLENNHNIIIAQRQEQQTDNNVFLGNAGFLPRVNVNGNFQHSVQNTYIEFAGDMPPIDRNNAASTTYGASLEMQYTLFDGLSRFYEYDRLQELGRQADAQTRLAIENTLFSIVQTFLEVARLKETVAINRKAVDLSVERLGRAENTSEYGGNTQLDVLNAKVDLNTDSVSLRQSTVNLENAKRNLNVLMGAIPDHTFTVNDDFDLNSSLEAESLMEQALQQNANLMLARYELTTARLDEKISSASQYPSLNLTGSYGYNRQENEAGFIASQEQLGFTGGVSLIYTVYDANVRSTRIQNASIATQVEQENVTLTLQGLRRDVLNTYANYQNNLFLLEKEEDNLTTAQLNFERSQTALRLGQINATQFREAQINLIRAQRSINNLYYQAKLSEVQLYRLAGILSGE